MGERHMKWAAAALLVFSAGCTQVPENAVYSCGENGSCPAPDTCRDGVCVSTGESADALCADAGYVCGELNVTDSCGQFRMLTCGSVCAAPALCHDGACC